MSIIEDLMEAAYDLIWGVIWLIGRVAFELVCLLAFLAAIHWAFR